MMSKLINASAFSPNLECALILWRSGLGLLMDKFHQFWQISDSWYWQCIIGSHFYCMAHIVILWGIDTPSKKNNSDREILASLLIGDTVNRKNSLSGSRFIPLWVTLHLKVLKAREVTSCLQKLSTFANSQQNLSGVLFMLPYWVPNLNSENSDLD